MDPKCSPYKEEAEGDLTQLRRPHDGAEGKGMGEKMLHHRL